MSLLLTIAVVAAVGALVVAFASMLVHPHVCALMQGDWANEPEREADAPAPLR